MDDLSPDTGFLGLTLVGFNPVWEDIRGNLRRLDALVPAVLDAFPETDIMVLPEAFATGGSMSPSMTGFSGSSPILSWMSSASARFGCAIAGSVFLTDGQGADDAPRFNRFCFCSPEGWMRTYDKRHLYFGQEEESLSAGTVRSPFLYKGWKILPGICFDLRFPLWCRNSRTEPYDLYLNVANWPVARSKAADILLKARAVENASYAAICNRSGSDPLLGYDGHCMIVNYRGREKGRTCDVDGCPVVSATLGRQEMLRYRRAFPVLDRIDEFNIGL